MSDIEVKVSVNSAGAEQGAQRVTRSLNDIRAAAAANAAEMDKVGASISRTVGAMDVLKAAAAGLGVGFSAKYALDQFAAIEKGLIGVGKTTDIAGADLVAFGNRIDAMARNMPVAQTRLLEIAQAAGSLGARGGDNIAKFTEVVAKMGTATDLVGEGAAQTISRMLELTHNTIDNADRLGATFVELGNNIGATESQIAARAAEIARSTSIYKTSTDDVAGIGAAFAKIGISSELAGSAVGRAFRVIDENTRAGADNLELLQQVTGKTAAEMRRAFNEDAEQAFVTFIAGLKRMKDEGENVPAIMKALQLGGEEDAKALLPLAENLGLVTKAMTLARNAYSDNTALNKEYGTAVQGFSAQMDILRNNVESTAAVFGAELAPAVRQAGESLKTALNDGSVKAAAEGLGAGVRVVQDNIEALTLVGGVLAARTLGPMASQVGRNAAEFGKWAVEANRSLVANRAAAVEAEGLARANRDVALVQLQMARAMDAATGGMARQRVAAAALQVANAELVTASARAATATQAASLMGRAASGAAVAWTALSGALGGPVGVAITAAAAAAYLLSSRTSEAEKAASAHNETMAATQRVADVTGGSIDELAKKYANLDATAKQAAKTQLQALQTAQQNEGKAIVSATDEALSGGLFGESWSKKFFNAGGGSQAYFQVSSILSDIKTPEGLLEANKALQDMADKADGPTKEALQAVTNTISDVVAKASKLSEESKRTTAALDAVNSASQQTATALTATGAAAVTAASGFDQFAHGASNAVTIAASLKDMMRELGEETKYLKIPDPGERGLQKFLDDAKKKVGRELNPDEQLAAMSSYNENRAAKSGDYLRGLQDEVKWTQELAKAQASGNVATAATAQAHINAAKALKTGQIVAGDYADTLKAEVSKAQAGLAGSAGEAATALSIQATAAGRMAEAAGKGEAAIRAATYANREAEAAAKGNVAISAVRMANAREEAASILTLRNETVRGLDLETAANDNMARAVFQGTDAVRAAAEEEYRLAMVRKLGEAATKEGTDAQKALNDAMDAYRRNRDSKEGLDASKRTRDMQLELEYIQKQGSLIGMNEVARDKALARLKLEQDWTRNNISLTDAAKEAQLSLSDKITEASASLKRQQDAIQQVASMAECASEFTDEMKNDPEIIAIFEEVFK